MAIRAGIDCGTNSIRLLIIDNEGRQLARKNTITRLGTGIDKTGVFDENAVALSISVVAEYAALCRMHGVEALRFGATSATRDSRNREIFVDPVTEILGVAPEVISGEEEAQLSFAGAIGSLDGLTEERCVLVDLGGGSTEIVSGRGTPDAAFSMNVGSVRMTERWFASDPATPSEREALIADVTTSLDEALAVVPVGSARHLIGVSGTIATVASHALGLQKRDASAVHGSRLPVDVVLASADELSRLNRDELAALPFMHPGRVAVTAAGALIWREVIRRIVKEMAADGFVLESVVTSINDILDGLAASATTPFSGRGERP